MSASFLRAPWTEEQVKALNDYQHSSNTHPFTCGNDRGNYEHKKYAFLNNDSDWGILVATKDGWVCPVCDYTQYWAHTFMGESK